MTIEDYLNRNAIVKIGTTLPGYVCCEVIVDNPVELVFVLQTSDCYISEIRWWDCLEIGNSSTIGYGGPRDPRNPDSFYFAETDICQFFSADSRPENYYEYLNHIKEVYPKHNLFPSFDIKRNKARDSDL